MRWLAALLILLAAWEAQAVDLHLPFPIASRSWIFRTYETNNISTPGCNPIRSQLVEFADANVVTGAGGTIANNATTNPSSGLYTGLPVQFTTGGTLPTGISAATTYYVVGSGSTVQLSDTAAHAVAGTNLVNIVAATGGTLGTFIDANVNTSTDTITIATASLTTGQGPIELTSSGVLPGGLSAFTDYYIIVAALNSVKLATSNANALAGTPVVDITSASGGGTHTVNGMHVMIAPAAATGPSTTQGWAIADFFAQVPTAVIRTCTNSQSNNYPTIPNASVNQYLPVGASTGVWTYEYNGIQRGGAGSVSRAWFYGLCDATSAAASVFTSTINGCTNFVGFYKPNASDNIELVSGNALGAATLDGTGAVVGVISSKASADTYEAGATDEDGFNGGEHSQFSVGFIHDNATGVVRAYFNHRMVGQRTVAAGTLNFDISEKAKPANSGHAVAAINEVTATLRTRRTGEP